MGKLTTCAISFLMAAALSIEATIISGAAFGQTVFRVIDEHGNVTFTDNPGRGGEALELAPLPSLPPGLSAATASVATPATERPRGKPGQPFMPYDHF